MEINKSYYAIIPANVRYDERLKLLSRMLYGEITALSNEKGYCWANNKYFGTLYRVSIQTISGCIKQLIDCGYITSQIIYKENSKEVEQRILKIVDNFNTPTKKIEEGIEENLNTPLKENFKDNNTSINNTINNILSDKELLEEKFLEFYNSYPRRLNKTKTKACYLKALTTTTPETILKGVENYKKYIEINKTEERFIKHPTTWLNQGCWEDEYNFSNSSSNGSTKPIELPEHLKNKDLLEMTREELDEYYRIVDGDTESIYETVW